jgi:hypothetical protein
MLTAVTTAFFPLNDLLREAYLGNKTCWVVYTTGGAVGAQLLKPVNLGKINFLECQ